MGIKQKLITKLESILDKYETKLDNNPNMSADMKKKIKRH